MSSFEKDFSPARSANETSIFGIGYLSSFDALFMVNLKLQHRRRDFLSYFRMGTTGAAQSANCRGSVIGVYPAPGPHCLTMRMGPVVRSC